ncbi:MAG: hypothetical protein IPK87_01625 [Planctomycetes bacterium]|nr:hypothetical protein [Planctomycetota bacterium]
MIRLLCALLVAVLCLGAVSADMQQLKRDIDALKTEVTEAQAKQSQADKALRENLDAQKTAQGKDLEALKQSAQALARTAYRTSEDARAAAQKLAAKQGELRNEASEQAAKQVSAAGALDGRVDSARTAIADWKAAVGEIPRAPQARDLAGIPADDRDAFRKTDISRLKDYESWAEAELKRIDNEVKAADKLAGWNVAAAKNGASLTSEAKSLKTSLEARRKSVQTAQASSKSTREAIEKQLGR